MLHPKCIASTQQLPHKYSARALENEVIAFGDGSNPFKSAQWSGDGTSIITSSADNHIRTFIVPPDLLEERAEPHPLSAYCTIPSHEPINAVVGYPFFDLQDPSTTLVLSSVREHPICLHSALTAQLVASYPLVNPMTEAVVSPHSLTFTPDCHSFIAGSDSVISTFDLSRPGQEPFSSLRTGPLRKRANWYDPSTSIRGIVSALALEPASKILAAGTFRRHVGLYDAAGQGDCIGVFSVEGTQADKHIGGSGITQACWTPCGRYLYIAERKSNGVILYDIRQTGQLLGWLDGRNANTNQRLGIDVVATDQQGGHEVWAGGLQGMVRVWKSAHEREGAVTPTFEWQGHEDAVASAVVHHTGNVVATASGQRHFWTSDEDEKDSQDTQVIDNSLKIWSI